MASVSKVLVFEELSLDVGLNQLAAAVSPPDGIADKRHSKPHRLAIGPIVQAVSGLLRPQPRLQKFPRRTLTDQVDLLPAK